MYYNDIIIFNALRNSNSEVKKKKKYLIFLNYFFTRTIKYPSSLFFLKKKVIHIYLLYWKYKEVFFISSYNYKV